MSEGSESWAIGYRMSAPILGALGPLAAAEGGPAPSGAGKSRIQLWGVDEQDQELGDKGLGKWYR